MVITAKGVHCTGMPLVLLNKPFGVLSQFRDDSGRPTLADFVQQKNVYPAGRLDRDSEGLLLLTDDGRLHRLPIWCDQLSGREFSYLQQQVAFAAEAPAPCHHRGRLFRTERHENPGLD